VIFHYFKFIVRQLRNKHAFINLSGLAVGFIAFLLIYLWVMEELSYDRFHVYQSRLFRVIENQPNADHSPYFIALTPDPLGPFLQNNYGEVDQHCRLVEVELLVRHHDQAFYQKGLAADPSFFDVFTFPVINGSHRAFQPGVDKIIVSERMASIYFDQENAVGKTLSIAGRELLVVGVMKNVPPHSHLQFDYVIPFEFLSLALFQKFEQWGWNRYHTYLLLKEDAKPELLTEKIRNVIKDHVPESKAELMLQPLADIHLKSGHINNDMAGRGSLQYTGIFSAVAIFILIIASINYANLATARSMKRAKEAGIRKVVGANRFQLMTLFFSESVIYCFVALGLAVFFAWLLLPSFNDLASKQLSFDIFSIRALGPLLVMVAFCALLGGAYPALLLSALNPAIVLKGYYNTGKLALIIRRGLVIFQFFLSISLLIGTLIIHHQLVYLQSRKLGFEKENILIFSSNRQLRQQYAAFKSELLTLPDVKHVTASNSKLSFSDQSTGNVHWEGKSPNHELIFHQLMVDYDFFSTYSIPIKEGRVFSPEIASDSLAVILNEEAVRQMKLTDPLQKKIIINDVHHGTIIGIVKDFNFKPAYKKIEPVIIYIDPSSYYEIAVQLNPGNLPEQVRRVESIYKKFNPDRPFEYSFLNEDIEKLYRNEERISKVFRYFSFLSIFISCMGLLGMAIYVTEQRAREVALRKIMGATVWQLIWLLTGEFILLVVIAFTLAAPFMYYTSSVWLAGFAYRIEPGIWIYLMAGSISLAIASVTVGYQSLRTSLANPIHPLRTE
jgi:putative ABC transport system permease protein